jgi:hypothetical protein
MANEIRLCIIGIRKCNPNPQGHNQDSNRQLLLRVLSVVLVVII